MSGSCVLAEHPGHVELLERALGRRASPTELRELESGVRLLAGETYRRDFEQN